MVKNDPCKGRTEQPSEDQNESGTAPGLYDSDAIPDLLEPYTLTAEQQIRIAALQAAAANCRLERMPKELITKAERLIPWITTGERE